MIIPKFEVLIEVDTWLQKSLRNNSKFKQLLSDYSVITYDASFVADNYLSVLLDNEQTAMEFEQKLNDLLVELAQSGEFMSWLKSITDFSENV